MNLVVFTGEPVARLIETMSSQGWIARFDRILGCELIVMTRHALSFQGQNPEEHRSGILLGRISGTEQFVDPHGTVRQRVHFDRFARVSWPQYWPGHRNPVWFNQAPIATQGLTWERG